MPAAFFDSAECDFSLREVAFYPSFLWKLENRLEPHAFAEQNLNRMTPALLHYG
jgi:hypothetical protein